MRITSGIIVKYRLDTRFRSGWISACYLAASDLEAIIRGRAGLFEHTNYMAAGLYESSSRVGIQMGIM